MSAAIEQALAAALQTGAGCIGELALSRHGAGFLLTHRDDAGTNELRLVPSIDHCADLVKRDARGNYRPLKTAPTLPRGWQLEVTDIHELFRALDYFYPARLAVFAQWKNGQLATTSLRQTLNRQTGMYRVAASIPDEQADSVIANLCRSDGGCLRTILWKRDERREPASTKLPLSKFDPGFDQTGRGENAIPLLCQEACNLLVNECRKAVKETQQLQ